MKRGFKSFSGLYQLFKIVNWRIGEFMVWLSCVTNRLDEIKAEKAEQNIANWIFKNAKNMTTGLTFIWRSSSKIKNFASSIQHKERKCTNKKVVLEKKKPKSRSNELCVNLFFDAVQPSLYISNTWAYFGTFWERFVCFWC